jgi:arsenite methyltransferase
MSQLVFDDDLAVQLDALYRTADVMRRRALVRAALRPAPGERILDVGCGPGYYVAELLEQVGPAGAVTGVDASEQLLALARRRNAGRANAAFQLADATALPVADASFDAALSVQVLEYVADVAAVLAELRRALRPGGRLVVWDVDWATVSWHSADPERMARVLRAWDGHLVHPSLPRTLAARLEAAGFDGVDMTGHVFATRLLGPDTYGAAVAPLIETYVAGRGGVGEQEAHAWAAEQRALAERGEAFFTCTQFRFGATRPR